MVINTNVMALSTANLLGASSRRLSQSLARLSSGSKINSPADDAAGLAVSMNFNAQIGRTDAANNNVSNALSFSQTQDGYLQQVSNALNRMSELAVQAQDVTKSDADRKLYNQEFQTLATYINGVGTKDFNGVSLFSGNDMNVTSDSEGGSFQMKGISGNFGVSGTTTTTSAVPYAANTKLGQISSTFNGNPSGDTVEIGSSHPLFDSIMTPASTVADLVNYLNSTGGDSSASYDSSTGQLSISAAPGFVLPDYGNLFSDLGFNCPNNWPGTAEGIDNRIHGASSPITISTMLTHNVTTTTTTSVPDISTADDAKAALTTIKNAISNLASKRADIGSNMERLNSTSEELSTLANNLSAANSRITDVDVAQESTNYAKENILVQTGTAMLAQANSLPQSVLKLLG
jgi:flagellin